MRTKMPDPPVATRSPLWLKRAALTTVVLSSAITGSWPATSKTRANRSPPTVNRRVLSGLNETICTSSPLMPLGWVNVASRRPPATLQRRAVPSELPLARNRPFGENARLRTAPSCGRAQIARRQEPTNAKPVRPIEKPGAALAGDKHERAVRAELGNADRPAPG